MSERLDLEGIRKRAEAATPGPWVLDGTIWAGTHSECDIRADNETYEDWYTVKSRTPEADAEFIAHSRSDIPLLIAEVERLRSELTALKSGSGGD